MESDDAVHDGACLPFYIFCMYSTYTLAFSTGYGSFSRSVLGACACSFFASGVENCVLSYVLPAARCELQLTTYQAGLINMAFMSGKGFHI